MTDTPEAPILKWYRAGDDSPWSGLLLMTEDRAEVVRPLWAQINIELVEVEDPQVSLVEQVKAYAKAHYDTGGWDVIIECWSDQQIADALQYWGPRDTAPRQCETIEQVLANSTLRSVVSVWGEEQAFHDSERRAALGDEDYERYYGRGH